MMTMNRVEGTNSRGLTLYTLSTCIWCRKTKALLKELDVGYEYVDLDLLEEGDKTKALEELKTFNPKCSFPSLVFDKSECIVGFDEPNIRKALKV